MNKVFFIGTLLASLLVLIVVLTLSSRKKVKPVSVISDELAPLPPAKIYDVSTCYVRPNNIDLRIFGGTDAGPQYPFVGALKYRDVYLCGVSLISPLWCLGAAHCISYLSDMTVTVGRFDLDLIDVGQVRKIVEFHAHPRFNTSTFDADIALFKLDKPIDDIRPICLPINDLCDRDEYIVVGWGATEKAEMTNKLQQVIVYRSKDCLASSPETVCAMNDKILGGPCLGDSGGPLFHLDEKTSRYIVDGIVSRGSSKCVSSPTVFTRVASYLDWILSTI